MIPEDTFFVVKTGMRRSPASSLLPSLEAGRRTHYITEG